VFKKSILVLLVTVFIFTGYHLYASTTVEREELVGFSNILPYIDSNRYTHMKSDEIVVSKELYEGYDTFDSSMGTIYLDSKSLAFQFEQNGYVYQSAPDITDEEFPLSVVYSMQSALNIQSYNTRNINYAVVRENLFTMGSNVSITYIENGFEAEVTFGTSQIRLTMIVLFDNGEVTIEIPNESIVENEYFKLKSIQVYKDFGAVQEDTVPGYVFVPDGIGALIDYDTDDLGVPNYKKSVYGNALGYNTEEDLNNLNQNEYRIYAPVFGFVHGVEQHGIFANILSGDLYANINVYYPSRNRGYTTIFSEFVYRHTYAQPIDQIGNTITLLQEDINQVNLKLKYTVLSGDSASYVGMAKTYKEYLLTIGASMQNPIERTPLMLSFLASENAPGIIWSNHIQLSTLEDILNIVEELNQSLNPNMNVSIEGFSKQGVSWSGPTYNKIDSDFGSVDELQQLSQLVDHLYMVTNHILAPTSGSGYSQYRDLASKINDQLYTFKDLTSDYYLLEYKKVESSFHDSLEMFSSLDVDHAYQSFGSLLYDDFKNELYLKNQVVMIQQLLGELDTEVALYDSNAYLYGYVDAIIEVPMYSSQYVSFDDTVPFLSIAMSNMIDLYSPSATFFPYVRDDLLRMIDFHIYPSFIVTTNYTTKLQETNLSEIYVSDYDVISPMIDTYYQFIGDALVQTLNASITAREVLQSGVVIVSYDNGLEIIINYTDQAVSILGVVVEAKHYEVGDFQ